MANEVLPFYETADRITAQASAAVTGKRFVTISGNRTSGPSVPAGAQVGASDPTEGGNYQVAPPAAGGAVLGVATWDAAIGEKVGVIRRGIVPVTAGGAIAAGVLVEVLVDGRVVANTTGRAVGMCMTAATSGADAEILLFT